MDFGKLLKFSLMLSFVWFSTTFGQSHQECGSQEIEAQNESGVSKENIDTVYYPLPGEGKRCSINEDYYFIYKFDKRPKIGTSILKIELFDKNGKKETSWKIVGNFGMPSMGGAHESGDIFFKLNQKGVYLLPISVVMPGEWEVKLKFIQNEKVVYQGSFRLHI
jgi:hypothetical protein